MEILLEIKRKNLRFSNENGKKTLEKKTNKNILKHCQQEQKRVISLSLSISMTTQFEASIAIKYLPKKNYNNGKDCKEIR